MARGRGRALHHAMFKTIYTIIGAGLLAFGLVTGSPPELKPQPSFAQAPLSPAGSAAETRAGS